MMPLLLMRTIFNIMKTRTPGLIRPLIATVLNKTEAAFLKPRLKAILDIAEIDLASTKWLTSDTLTAADIVMSYAMEGLSIAGGLEDRPNCQRWVKQMHGRASFISAREKDGRDDIAFRA